MAYSDAEMQIASLAAYLDIPAGTSLGRYMDTHPDNPRVQRIREISLATTGSADSYDTWRIVGVGDDNTQSGMYGCMIDDGRGNAIFAFRGSEGLGKGDSPQQLINDWLGADAGLLNSSETWQQEQAERFVREMYEKYGDQYNNFAFTGHSLGGNLAIDAALDAPAGMRDKITQIVGLDSPGFSDEWWVTHATRIAEMQDRITHYQWSVVGAILLTPGVTHSVNVLEDSNLFGRHPLANLDTGTGSVTYRDPDSYTAAEMAAAAAVVGLDFSNCPFGGLLYGLAKFGQDFNRYVIHRGQDMKISTARTSESMAVFEVSISGLQALESRYASIESDMRQAQSVIEDMADALKYHSLVGYTVKYLLRTEATSVKQLADLLKKHRDVLQYASTEYVKADTKAESGYSGLPAIEG